MEVLDPVCGMRFDMEEAAAQSEYAGNKYYFCGEGCREAFDDDPERFLGQDPDDDSEKLS